MKLLRLASPTALLMACLFSSHAVAAAETPPPDLLEFGRRIESEHAAGRFRALTHQFDLKELERRMLLLFPETQRDSPEVAAQIDSTLAIFQDDSWALRFKGSACRFVHCRKEVDHWRLVFLYTGPRPGNWAFVEFLVHPGEFYAWEIFDSKNYVNGMMASEFAVLMGKMVPEFEKLAPALGGATKDEQRDWMMANLAALNSGTRYDDWPKVLETLDRLPASFQADPFIRQVRLLGYEHTGNHSAYLKLYRELRGEFPARDLGEMSVFTALLEAGELDEAEKILAKLRTDLGGHRALDSLAAELVSKRGNETEAIRLLRSLVAAEPDLFLGYLGLIPRIEDEGERKQLLAEVEKRFGAETAHELAANDDTSPEALLKQLQEQLQGPGDQNLSDFVKGYEERLKHESKPLELPLQNCVFGVWPGEPWRTKRDIEPESGVVFPVVAQRSPDGATISLMRQQNSQPVYLDDSTQERFFIAGLVAAQKGEGAEVLEQEKTTLAGQPCVRLHARQKNGDVELHSHGWFFALGERTLGLVVTCPRLDRLENDPELARIVHSFRFLKPEANPTPAPKRELPKTARADFDRWHCAFTKWPEAGWLNVIEEPLRTGANEGVEVWTLRSSMRKTDDVALTCNVLPGEDCTADLFTNPIQKTLATNLLRDQSKQENKTVKSSEERTLLGRTILELHTATDDGHAFSRILLIPADGRLFFLVIEAGTQAGLKDPQVEQWIASFEVAGER